MDTGASASIAAIDPATPPRAKATRAGLARAGLLLAGASVLGTCASYFGAHHWLLDLLAHFKVHYVAALVLGSFAAWATRRRVMLGVFLIALCVNALDVAALYRNPAFPPSGTAASEDDRLRLLLLNVHTHFGDPPTVRNYIAETEPDVMVLIEVNASWLDALSEVLVAYPYRETSPREDNFGIALFSRHPLERLRLTRRHAEESTAVEGTLGWGGQTLHIIGTHPTPPFNRTLSALRDRQLSRLGNYVANIDTTGPDRTRAAAVLVVGDLNATPWSHGYRQLTATSGLNACAREIGLPGTWPSPMRWLGIPIDHCLLRGSGFEAHQSIGPDLGSDHRPLLITVMKSD